MTENGRAGRAASPAFQEAVAQAFKKWLLSRGMTKREAAKKLGVTRAALYAYCDGTYCPRAMILRLAITEGLELIVGGRRFGLEAFPLRDIEEVQPLDVQLPLPLAEVVSRLPPGTAASIEGSQEVSDEIEYLVRFRFKRGQAAI